MLWLSIQILFQTLFQCIFRIFRLAPAAEAPLHNMNNIFTGCDSAEVVIATSRVKACAIGGRLYSASRYGDDPLGTNSVGDSVTIKGSTHGVSDKPMIEAFNKNTPVLVCVHLGKGNLLPKPVGLGRVTEVRPGTSTKHEFVVKFEKVIRPRVEFPPANTDDPNRGKHCWIKRQFMREVGVTPVNKNHMSCFVKCRVTRN